MNLAMIIIWCICAFIVVWAMVGYPGFLQILDKLIKAPQIKKDYSYVPTVTILVVAHNEEKVIWEKLENLMTVSYPKDKLTIMVTSDFSTDQTNALLKNL